MYETFQFTVWFCISRLTGFPSSWEVEPYVHISDVEAWKGSNLCKATSPRARGEPETPHLRRTVKILVTEWERVQMCHLYTLSYSSVYYLETLFTYLLGFTDGNTKFQIVFLLQIPVWWMWRVQCSKSPVTLLSQEAGSSGKTKLGQTVCVCVDV